GFGVSLAEGRAFAWFLQATRSGRYSGSAITTLDQDIRSIEKAQSASEAFSQLQAVLQPWDAFTSEDFNGDYRDRFLRLMVYLVMYDRKAQDWVTHDRLGFHGTELLERFNPHWH